MSETKKTNTRNKYNTPRSPLSAKRGGHSRTTFDSSTCLHSPKCKNRPWHICSLIAEAAELEATSFTKAELSQGKQLAEVPDDDIRGTVVYMREVNGDFWGRKKRITPAAVVDNLPLYRKHRGLKMNGQSVSPPTEAELLRYVDQLKGARA